MRIPFFKKILSDPPTFSCSDAAYAWTGFTDVTIVCNVSANPESYHALFWWRQGETERLLDIGVRTNEFSTDKKGVIGMIVLKY